MFSRSRRTCCSKVSPNYIRSQSRFSKNKKYWGKNANVWNWTRACVMSQHWSTKLHWLHSFLDYSWIIKKNAYWSLYLILSAPFWSFTNVLWKGWFNCFIFLQAIETQNNTTCIQTYTTYAPTSIKRYKRSLLET